MSFVADLRIVFGYTIRTSETNGLLNGTSLDTCYELEHPSRAT